MQVAEILSDLTSLRACDHDAALTLVSSHKASALQSSNERPVQRKSSSPSASHTNSGPGSVHEGSDLKSEDTRNDVDLQRAIDLMDLHYGVKMKHIGGLNKGLEKAREDVFVAMRTFNVDKESGKR